MASKPEVRILQFSEKRTAALKCLHFLFGGQGTVIHFAQFLNWCQHPSGSEFKSGTTSFIFTWISNNSVSKVCSCWIIVCLYIASSSKPQVWQTIFNFTLEAFGTYEIPVFLMFQARSGVNKCDHLKLLVSMEDFSILYWYKQTKNALDIIAN